MTGRTTTKKDKWEEHIVEDVDGWAVRVHVDVPNVSCACLWFCHSEAAVRLCTTHSAMRVSIQYRFRSTQIKLCISDAALLKREVIPRSIRCKKFITIKVYRKDRFSLSVSMVQLRKCQRFYTDFSTQGTQASSANMILIVIAMRMVADTRTEEVDDFYLQFT
jgi:hypothetical protein